MVRAAYTVILAVFAVAATPATPAPTPPPQIYRVVTRPLCSELHDHIAPAIGMMLQNDTSIKKSPALFKQYNMARSTAAIPRRRPMPRQRVPGDPGGGTSNPAQSMALLRWKTYPSDRQQHHRDTDAARLAGAPSRHRPSRRRQAAANDSR